jgi:hypothetical protein
LVNSTAKEFDMKDLSRLGVKPSSTFDRYQQNVETMFLLASFVAGFGVLVCVYDEFVRREPYNKMIRLSSHGPLLLSKWFASCVACGRRLIHNDN